MHGYMPTCVSIPGTPSPPPPVAEQGEGEKNEPELQRPAAGALPPGVVDCTAVSRGWAWSPATAVAEGRQLRMVHREWLASPAAVGEGWGMDAAVSDGMLGHEGVAWLDAGAGPVKWTNSHGDAFGGGDRRCERCMCVCVCVCVCVLAAAHPVPRLAS
jgi:hypothetical protein